MNASTMVRSKSEAERAFEQTFGSATVTKPSEGASGRAGLMALRTVLNARFYERDDIVDGLLIGLLSRRNVFLLGPPGGAKSELARDFCKGISGSTYFEYMLTKFTTPDELFGPISLPDMEQGRYVRITTNRLPEAHISFLDEVDGL